jgi:CheY-like chemotaxis protein
VLVADDNEGIRATTSLILREEGYEVVEAVDGADALAKLAAASFDVALLDVQMPKQDGITVVENMFPEPPPPGVIMITAYDIGDGVRDRLGTRVYKYLRKPVTPAHLIDVVGEAATLSKAAST